MIQTVRRRLVQRGSEQGFTLTELLVVLVIIGILLSIAIATYVGVRDRATEAAAQTMIRQIEPSIEAYYADHSTYGGMTLATLRSDYDQALVISRYRLSGLSDTTYCVDSSYGSSAWRKQGPAAQAEAGTCP